MVIPHFDSASAGFYESFLHGADVIGWCLVGVHDGALVLKRVVQVTVACDHVEPFLDLVLFAIASRAQ